MKLTRVLEEALQHLKENTLLYKMQHIYGVPHRFGPAAYANREPVNGKINGRSVWGFPNTQSLNKLVLLGYAEYVDKGKTIIKYIDKDTIEAELKRKAAIYDRIKSLEPEAVFEDMMTLDPLDISEEDLLSLNNENLKMLYDNLLHMLFGAFEEIESWEKEYERLQNHIENIRGRL